MTFLNRHCEARVRAFAALLRRVTPHQTEAAAIIGISRGLMSMYCNVEDPDHNFPAALLSLHPEAHELLDALAREIGYDLVPRPDGDELDGSVADERNEILVLLGRIAEIEQKAERAAGLTLTRARALKLREHARQLRRLATQLESEVDYVINREDR
jgi:hypothetical protein